MHRVCLNQSMSMQWYKLNQDLHHILSSSNISMYIRMVSDIRKTVIEMDSEYQRKKGPERNLWAKYPHPNIYLRKYITWHYSPTSICFFVLSKGQRSLFCLYFLDPTTSGKSQVLQQVRGPWHPSVKGANKTLKPLDSGTPLGRQGNCFLFICFVVAKQKKLHTLKTRTLDLHQTLQKKRHVEETLSPRPNDENNTTTNIQKKHHQKLKENSSKLPQSPKKAWDHHPSHHITWVSPVASVSVGFGSVFSRYQDLMRSHLDHRWEGRFCWEV